MSYCLSIVIPTYRRGRVLLETIRYLLEILTPSEEILVVDQTESHPAEILSSFRTLGKGIVRRIVLPKPSIPCAMNVGLQEAKGDIVLFLDDDIVPDENLIAAHRMVHEQFSEAWAVVGQVLQPEDGFQVLENGNQRSKDEDQFILRSSTSESVKAQQGFHGQARGHLRGDLGFKFNSNMPAWIENVMAGNLSVKKGFALQMGGFDENFIPPVSYRFETEFAKRLIGAGGKIRFEPSASIKHLRAGHGGTRSRGSHLSSASPIHGVGDYYYALRCGQGLQRITYMLKRPFREVCTKFHFTHPWFIPVKLIGELRAMSLGIRLWCQGARLLPPVSVDFSGEDK